MKQIEFILLNLTWYFTLPLSIRFITSVISLRQVEVRLLSMSRIKSLH